MLTLRGKYNHREFITEDGKVFGLHGDFGVSEEVFVLCDITPRGNLSIFKTFEQK